MTQLLHLFWICSRACYNQNFNRLVNMMTSGAAAVAHAATLPWLAIKFI